MVVIVSIPLVQSYFFNLSNSGKIVIEKNIEAKFLRDVKNNVIVMFFGYVGCVDVCTPILDKLNMMYNTKQLQEVKNSFNVVFINLTPKIEKEQANIFAKAFNEKFQGIYLTQKELFNIEREFGLFFSDDFFDKNELTHTDYIYLLHKTDEKGYLLKNMYTTHPVNEEILIKDIVTLAKKAK